MSRAVSSMVATVFLAAVAGYQGLLQAEEPAVAAEARKLIAQLNDPDTLKREDAEKKLLEKGPAVLPFVKEAQTHPVPEVAARAKRLVSKLAQAGLKPFNTFSDVLPATSIFYLEAPNARGTLDRLKASPLGRFWDSPAMSSFFKKHREEQVPNDQKVLDAVREIPKFAEGRALFALGDPGTAEAAELDPPLIYVLETKQPQGLETPIRGLFQGMGDPVKATRPYGPFTIEEHITAQTVFGQDRAIHSLTQKGIESFLDLLVNRPKEALTAELAAVRALMPQHDFVFRINASGFKALSDAGQMIDDDQIKVLDALGFVEGSRWDVVAGFNADGVEEHELITLGGAEKNTGLMAVLKKMGSKPAVANGPQALDMIPWQTGILLSLNGDLAGNAAAMAEALRGLDEQTAPPQREIPRPTTPPVKPGEKPGEKMEMKDDKSKATGLGAAALKAGGGVDTTKPAAEGETKEPKPVAPRITPRISRLERLGVRLEQLFEQSQGPVQLALFPQRVEEDAPETFPLSPLLVMVLKDPAPLRQALDAAAAGPEPRYVKESLNGGTHYVDSQGDAETKPGFWIKDNYFAYSTERDLLDIGGVALAHARGNERMADRASYKKALAAKQIDVSSVLTIFGDAEFVLDMPYKLAKVSWQDNEENPWPDFDKVAKPILAGKPVWVQFKSTEKGLQVHAQTPLSLLGMVEAFRRPLVEANY